MNAPFESDGRIRDVLDQADVLVLFPPCFSVCTAAPLAHSFHEFFHVVLVAVPFFFP